MKVQRSAPKGLVARVGGAAVHTPHSLGAMHVRAPDGANNARRATLWLDGTMLLAVSGIPQSV